MRSGKRTPLSAILSIILFLALQSLLFVSWKCYFSNSEILVDHSNSVKLTLPAPTFDSTFHILEKGKEVAGVFFVDSEHSDFNFANRFKWRLKRRPRCEEKDRFTYIGGYCTWCPRDLEGTYDCRKTRVAEAGIVGLANSNLELPDVEVINRRRSYSIRNASLPQVLKNYVVWLRCTFDETIPENVEGELSLSSLVRLKFPVNPHLSYNQPAKKTVLCGRNLYGLVNPTSVDRFLKFYKEVWKFDSIIMYETGLTSTFMRPTPFVRSLITSGYLKVVDLRPMLAHMYGSFAHDVLFFSWVIGQTLIRLDCELRAKILGFEWTFFADMDEFLFPPRTSFQGVEQISFKSLIESFKDTYWLSFGSLQANDSVGCSCDSETKIETFLESAQHYHIDVEWNSMTKDRGPFECVPSPRNEQSGKDSRLCRAWFGRRKMAVSLLDHRREFGTLEVHDFYGCPYPGRDRSKYGKLLNAEHFPYIRHYRCLNHPCNEAGERVMANWDNLWWRSQLKD